jgi:hypothetical protein
MEDHAMEDHAMEDHALEDHAMEDHAMEDHALEDHAMEDTKEWEYYQNGLVLYGYSYLKTYCIQRRQTQPTSFVQSALFQRILHDVVRQLHVHRHPICHALPKENNKRAGWLIQHIVRVYYNLPFARSRDLARFRKLLGWLKQLAPKDGYSHLSACASAADNEDAVVAACVAADASLADADADACVADEDLEVLEYEVPTKKSWWHFW